MYPIVLCEYVVSCCVPAGQDGSSNAEIDADDALSHDHSPLSLGTALLSSPARVSVSFDAALLSPPPLPRHSVVFDLLGQNEEVMSVDGSGSAEDDAAPMMM